MLYVGMLNKYRLTDYPNINRSSNLKMKNRYLKFFDVTRTSPAYAVYVLYSLCLRSDTSITSLCNAAKSLFTNSGWESYTSNER